jgi:hypothetical protein
VGFHVFVDDYVETHYERRQAGQPEAAQTGHAERSVPPAAAQ